MGDYAAVALPIPEFFRHEGADAVALLRARWRTLLSAVRLDPAGRLFRDTSRGGIASLRADHGFRRIIRRHSRRPFGTAIAAHDRTRHRGLRPDDACSCRSQATFLG